MKKRHSRYSIQLRSFIIVFVMLLLGATLTLAEEKQRMPLPEVLMKQGSDAFAAGRFVLAIQKWETAAGIYKNEAKINRQADALISLAEGYKALGQHIKAMELLQPLLSGELKEPGLLSKLYGSLGQLYYLTNQRDKARQYLDEALGYAEKADDMGLKAIALNSRGNYFTLMADLPAALEAYQSSRNLAIQISDIKMQVKTAFNIARIHYEQKQYAKAVQLLETAAQLFNGLQNTQEKASDLIALGELAMRIAEEVPDYQAQMILAAYGALNAAKIAAEAIADPLTGSAALAHLGALYEKESRYDEALQLTRQAIFKAQQTQSSDLLYRYLWQAGRILKKQNKIDSALSSYRQSIYHLQRIRDDYLVDCRSGNRVPYRSIAAPIYFELADLLFQHSSTLTDRKLIEQDLVDARRSVEELKAFELQDYYRDECMTERYKKEITLERISPHTAALYPVIFPDRLELLVSLPEGLQRFTVPISEQDLTAEVRRFRYKLEDSRSRYLRYARNLYNWLILPIEKELDRQKVDTIVFIRDGALRTIPVASLHSGKGFLIQKYAIVTAPSMTLVDPQPLNRSNINILLSGLTESVQGFSPLPNVGYELQEIQNIFKNITLKDNDFVMSKVENALTRTPYTIVHIASHGQFGKNPEDTFLLTFDGRLDMNQLEGLMSLNPYRKEPVELITLSACQTAAGDDRAALGLAGVAVKAGARSAIASLWFVGDKATSKLMADFYKKINNSTISKAKALQQVQITFLSDPQYKHPAHWAPFLLIGNWL